MELKVDPADAKIFDFLSHKTIRQLESKKFLKAYFVQPIPIAASLSLFGVLLLLTPYISHAPHATLFLATVVLSYLIGFTIAFSQFKIVFRLDFRVLYWLRRIGEKLSQVSIVGFLVLFAVSGALPRSEITPDVSNVQAELFSILLTLLSFGVGVGAYANIFKSGKLASTCFRQAIELDGSSKQEWIRRGFRELKEYVREFGIDFDRSTFERMFAIRIADAQRVDDDLSALASTSPLTSLKILLNRQDMDFITVRKGIMDRISLDLLFKIIKLLSIAIGTVLAILAALGFIHIPLGVSPST